MSSKENDQFLEIGVDYATTTTLVRRTDKRLNDLGHHLLAEEARRGEKSRVWRFSGYRGTHAGETSYGVRHDGEILRLSGHFASQYWECAANLASNVTRLDVQATVRPRVGPTARLRSIIRAVRRHHATRGRPPKLKVWSNHLGPETIYLGSRQSDIYTRIYDKYAESKLEEYKGALRYECELKREAAKSMVQHLQASENKEAAIAVFLYKFLSARINQTAVPWTRLLYKHLSASYSSLPTSGSKILTVAGWRSPEDTMASRRILWFHYSIRPSVQSFVSRGELKTVLEALGLDQHVVPRETNDYPAWSKFRKVV